MKHFQENGWNRKSVNKLNSEKYNIFSCMNLRRGVCVCLSRKRMTMRQEEEILMESAGMMGNGMHVTGSEGERISKKGQGDGRVP